MDLGISIALSRFARIPVKLSPGWTHPIVNGIPSPQGALAYDVTGGVLMGREEEPTEPQKPQIEPGKPLRPDPG